jgi:hypothetical protein
MKSQNSTKYKVKQVRFDRISMAVIESLTASAQFSESAISLKGIRLLKQNIFCLVLISSCSQ